MIPVSAVVLLMASVVSSIGKSEESGIQGYKCPTQTPRGVVTWATTRGDTGRLGACACDVVHPRGGFEVIRQPRLDDLGNRRKVSEINGFR